MEKVTGTSAALTIGIDLGDLWSVAIELDGLGDVVRRERIRTTRAGMESYLGGRCAAMVAIEVGTHSPWVSRVIASLGHEGIVANPRRVRLIGHSDRKNDAADAERLARLARADVRLLSPVRHKGEQAQKDRGLLCVRDGVVRARTLLINQARNLAKSLGLRISSCDAGAFAARAARELGEERFAGQTQILALIAHLTTRIRVLDREIEAMARERYPETERLRQVAGVGPVTSLAYVLCIEDPQRFERSRAVGSYLGLCPRQRDSGAQRPQLRISKAGDGNVRRLLVQAAHYILGHFGPDTDLRRQGLQLIARGGKAAGKRARIAVARKLAVLLHRLWVSGEIYEPLRTAHARERSAAA